MPYRQLRVFVLNPTSLTQLAQLQRLGADPGTRGSPWTGPSTLLYPGYGQNVTDRFTILWKALKNKRCTFYFKLTACLETPQSDMSILARLDVLFDPCAAQPEQHASYPILCCVGRHVSLYRQAMVDVGSDLPVFCPHHFHTHLLARL